MMRTLKRACQSLGLARHVSPREPWDAVTANALGIRNV
jgi:hypothetical protein